MGYLEIFRKYLAEECSAQDAEEQIKAIQGSLRKTGQQKEYAKCSYVLTYFKRLKQYQNKEIKVMDLLLFIRNFVLFVGRFRFPDLITDAVQKSGNALSLYIGADGAVDVSKRVPDALKEHQNFVDEVYQLEESQNTDTESSGDAYLKGFTCFSSYRSLEQKVAVHCAIDLPDDYTLMIALPTGGGKSLITQLLATCENKLTLVIVPTVSLAEDQYLQARSCISREDVKDKIYCFRSGSDDQALIHGVEDQTARLIFTSPEAILKNEQFNVALRKAAEDKYLHNVIIDEAHMVPDWGADFRPDFQIFSVVLSEWRNLSAHTIRTYLLSATLSDNVVSVLFDLYGQEGRNVQYRCDALRREPRYTIVKYTDFSKREESVLDMILFLPKPMIVYVIQPEMARDYQRKLKGMGISNVNIYTGETDNQSREYLLEKWKNNDFDVMIATSAFGLGVDKGNVRTILHACMPENLSRFYQEVGRSGRDGLPSLSVLVYYQNKDDDRRDSKVAFSLVKSSVLTLERLMIRWKSIIFEHRNIIEGDLVKADLSTPPMSFSEEEKEHAGRHNIAWNANMLLLLHRLGYIHIERALYSEGTYFFCFRLLDLSIVHNDAKLASMLKEDRSQEYDRTVEGYNKMMELIQHPKSRCWGERFALLYPYARPICSGCPVHPEGSDVTEDKIRIRCPAVIDLSPDPPGPRLNRLLAGQRDIMVPVESYEKVNVKLLAEKADKLQLAAMICPDTCSEIPDAGCMTLTHSEFLTVARKIPWIFRNGCMIIFTSDDHLNNELYLTATEGNMKDYIKVWCCRPDSVILSQNRRICDFLDCHTYNIDNL